MGLLALRRYLPYLRPYAGLVAVFGLAQLGSLATAASIPKIIQYIIDGPVTHHQLTQLVQMAGFLVLIGLLEFVFIFLRRNFSGVVSLRMRDGTQQNNIPLAEFAARVKDRIARRASEL